jgi:hypothetical protein
MSRSSNGLHLSSSSLNDLSLTPGVYVASSYITLGSSVLTFDGLGDPNSVFIVTSSSYLAVSPGALMVLVNGGELVERPYFVLCLALSHPNLRRSPLPS